MGDLTDLDEIRALERAFHLPTFMVVERGTDLPADVVAHWREVYGRWMAEQEALTADVFAGPYGRPVGPLPRTPSKRGKVAAQDAKPAEQPVPLWRRDASPG